MLDPQQITALQERARTLKHTDPFDAGVEDVEAYHEMMGGELCDIIDRFAHQLLQLNHTFTQSAGGQLLATLQSHVVLLSNTAGEFDELAALPEMPEAAQLTCQINAMVLRAQTGQGEIEEIQTALTELVERREALLSGEPEKPKKPRSKAKKTAKKKAAKKAEAPASPEESITEE